MDATGNEIVQLPNHWVGLRELEGAIHAHSEWFQALNRALVCDLPLPSEEVDPEAFRHCDFGCWYYGEHEPGLANHAGFHELEETHRRVHELAHHLILNKQAGGVIHPDEYIQLVKQSHLLGTELRALQFQLLGEQFEMDPLTGVPGRRNMMARLEQESARIERSGGASVICMIDFDRFKLVNDTYGHRVGDDVLKRGAECIREQLRPYDLIFRYGGEEFLVCYVDSKLDQAQRASDRIRSALAELVIPLPEGGTIQITASFGLANLQTSAHLEAAITNADHALLEAKREGRNCIISWPERPEPRSES